MGGVPIGMKDLFATKGVQTTAASHILEGFKPQYESTVSQNLWDAGAGMLGKAVLEHGDCPRDLSYRGLEKAKRGGEPIDVLECTARRLPFADRAFDVVILADVLHHEEQHGLLLDEACLREHLRELAQALELPHS